MAVIPSEVCVRSHIPGVAATASGGAIPADEHQHPWSSKKADNTTRRLLGDGRVAPHPDHIPSCSPLSCTLWLCPYPRAMRAALLLIADFRLLGNGRVRPHPLATFGL